MTISYNWLAHAQHNKQFREKIYKAMASDEVIELTHMDTYRLQFDPVKMVVTVMPFSDSCDLGWKIIPVQIRYKAVTEVISGNWAALDEADNVINVH